MPHDPEKLSKPARDLLLQVVFRPSRRHARLSAAWVENVLRCDEGEADGYLNELVEEGFVRPYENGAKKSHLQGVYQPAEAAWAVSEKLQRTCKMRRQPLVAQGSYNLKDLILAICFEGHSINRNLKGGVLGTTTDFPVEDLLLILDAHESEVEVALEELVRAKYLQRRDRKAREGGGRYVDLTPRGLRFYEDHVAPKLGVSNDDSILSPPPQSLEVFFAWQSENARARDVLWEAVPEAVRKINEGNDLLRKLRLVLASEAGEGALRVDAAIESKIRKADYFVGDLTPVYAYKGRLRVSETC